MYAATFVEKVFSLSTLKIQAGVVEPNPIISIKSETWHDLEHACMSSISLAHK